MRSQKLSNNEYLDKQTETIGDYLYHLGMGTETVNFEEKFGDVKFVLVAGSASRITKFAHKIKESLGFEDEIIDLAKDASRYTMYKVGPIICINHNIGAPTLSIVLHEVFKLLDHAKVNKQDVHLIRLGTCGGLGVEPGSIIITDKNIDGLKREHFHSIECGRQLTLKMNVDKEIANELYQLALDLKMPAVIGTTMGTDDFYLGQARLDGAFTSYTERDKFEFLIDLNKNYNCKNIEMESHVLTAFANRAGLKCSVCCVALLNRLNGDQVTTPTDILKGWEARPLDLVIEYIKKKVRN